MAYTTYSASQAVERANATTTWQTAMCLEFVWHCLTNIRANLPDANAAWAAVKQPGTGTPPPGAPVYFRGFAHGHIALSLGGGRIRSTDWPTKGRVGTTTIGDLCREWYGSQANYLGWSRDYAGQIIRGLEETSTVNSGTPPLPVTQEDDMPTAAELWGYQTKMLDAAGKPIDALQALADARTGAQRAQSLAATAVSDVTALKAQVAALKAALPGLPDDADVAALKAQLAELKALVAALPKG